MKKYQRRAASAYPYWKLATWDGVSLTWRDGKRAFASHDEASDAARKSGAGRYRISVVTADGRRDLDPFAFD